VLLPIVLLLGLLAVAYFLGDSGDPPGNYAIE
jgi:hypothetical protein